jgi:hypothetical protein
MPKFVELWVYLSATPLFGLTATLVTYVLAHALYVRVNQAPWANCCGCRCFVINCAPYPTYFFRRAQFTTFAKPSAGPVVAATGRIAPALLVASLAEARRQRFGCCIGGRLPTDVLLSLAPSVTACSCGHRRKTAAPRCLRCRL